MEDFVREKIRKSFGVNQSRAQQPRCKSSLASACNIPEPVCPKSPGNVGAEEIISKTIWGFLSFSSVPEPSHNFRLCFQVFCSCEDETCLGFSLSSRKTAAENHAPICWQSLSALSTTERLWRHHGYKNVCTASVNLWLFYVSVLQGQKESTQQRGAVPTVSNIRIL